MSGSDGFVVEASVVARLLRLRLLSIDARVVVSPAHVTHPSPAAALRLRSGAIGAGLPAAERCIKEGAASLAASQSLARSGITPRRRAAVGRGAGG